MNPDPITVAVDRDAPPLDRYRTWRRANRPFRRAFGGLGGERQRRILMEAGMALAAERNRKAAGL